MQFKVSIKHINNSSIPLVCRFSSFITADRLENKLHFIIKSLFKKTLSCGYISTTYNISNRLFKTLLSKKTKTKLHNIFFFGQLENKQSSTIRMRRFGLSGLSCGSSRYGRGSKAIVCSFGTSYCCCCSSSCTDVISWRRMGHCRVCIESLIE